MNRHSRFAYIAAETSISSEFSYESRRVSLKRSGEKHGKAPDTHSHTVILFNTSRNRKKFLSHVLHNNTVEVF